LKNQEMHMRKASHRLVVVGHGAAGLAAALAAVETARRHDFPVEVALVEKAPEESAGGNTL
jgi:tricarballylate dehydrogenase